MIHQLNCKNCGAKLEVRDDTEIFSCGYCGSQQQVDRTGGIVQLRKIESAINAIRSGTDKTAAELAIVRLEKELPAAERELEDLISTCPPPPRGPQITTFEVLISMALYTFLSLYIIVAATQWAFGPMLFSLSILCLLAYFQYRQGKARKLQKQQAIERYRRDEYEPYEHKYYELTAKLDVLKKQLQENRAIANGQ